MGHGTFDPGAYRAFTTATASAPLSGSGGVYSSSSIHKDLDPRGVKVRESRDSADHPLSTPIAIFLDVTGSMGMIADTIARGGLGTLIQGILDRKPVTDPHIMFGGVGDAYCDRAPLQVSQFESDNRIVQQLTQLWLEHGGGGNNFESYNLPWYFAARHTVHDAFEKRGKKGYLFTIGDECAPGPLTPEQIKTIIGDDYTQPVSSEELLREAQRTYNVFHVIIEEGNYARGALGDVRSTWRELLGQNVISLSDHTKLAETIVSAIEVAEGTADAVTSAKKWGAGSGVIHDAVKHLSSTGAASRPLLGRS